VTALNATFDPACKVAKAGYCAKKLYHTAAKTEIYEVRLDYFLNFLLLHKTVLQCHEKKGLTSSSTLKVKEI